MSKQVVVARCSLLFALSLACSAPGSSDGSGTSKSGPRDCPYCNEPYDSTGGLEEVRAKFERSEARRLEAHNARVRALHEHIRASGGYKGALESELESFETYVREGKAQQHEDLRAPENIAKELEEIVKCDRVSISWVSSDPVIEPLTEVVVLGCQFGFRPGKLFLVLINERYRQEEFTIDPGDWNDGDIRAKVPYVDKVFDQPALMYLIRADGTRSDDYEIDFRASRIVFEVPAKLLTVYTTSTTTEDSFTLGNLVSPSGRADHWQSCCWPPTHATDRWHASLFNGYVAHSLKYEESPRKSSWALAVQPGRIDSVTGFVPGASTIDVDVNWWTDQYESGVEYALRLFVTGPRGFEPGPTPP